MRKFNLFLIIAIAAFFGACNNDQDVNMQPNINAIAPQIIATVEVAETRAGVVEDADYTQGEKFYWSAGDQTNVFFKNASMSTPSQYIKGIYTATPVGEKSNTANFSHNGIEGLTNGTYTAYGFFPAAAWDLNAASADFLKVTIPTVQTQNAANSLHLGAYLPMKAQNEVTVDGTTPAHLSYKQLASVVRFAVWNSSSNTNLQLKDVSISMASNENAFGVAGKLDNIEGASITVDAASKVSKITVNLTGNAQNFATKDGMSQCEAYMALLPVTTSGEAVAELTLTDGTDDYTVTRTLNLFPSGIVKGNSYYWRIKIEDEDLSNEEYTPVNLIFDYVNPLIVHTLSADKTQFEGRITDAEGVIWSRQLDLSVPDDAPQIPRDATILKFDYQLSQEFGGGAWNRHDVFIYHSTQWGISDQVLYNGIGIPAAIDNWATFTIDLTETFAKSPNPDWATAEGFGRRILQLRFHHGDKIPRDWKIKNVRLEKP